MKIVDVDLLQEENKRLRLLFFFVPPGSKLKIAGFRQNK